MPAIVLSEQRSGATARILAEAGFNCFDFHVPGVGSVLESAPDFESTGADPAHSGIPLLFPFPNRIRGGRFAWEGREYVLEGIRHDARGNAIHGLVFDRPWRTVQHDSRSALGEFRLSIDAPDRLSLWPADFLLEVRYELGSGTLRCDVWIVNPGSAPLPWGFGTHPYFRVPLAAGSKAADCLIQAPAASVWELIDCLPTGRREPVEGSLDLREGQPLGGLVLDHAFTDLELRDGYAETVVMDPEGGLQVTQASDAVFRHLVVYTPPHGRSVCLEPYTCVTDAVHLAEQGIDGGWAVLPPGGEFRTWFQLTAGPVYA